MKCNCLEIWKCIRLIIAQNNKTCHMELFFLPEREKSSLWIWWPINACGFVEGPVESFVEKEGVKDPGLAWCMKHQHHRVTCHGKLPATSRRQHVNISVHKYLAEQGKGQVTPETRYMDIVFRKACMSVMFVTCLQHPLNCDWWQTLKSLF